MDSKYSFVIFRSYYLPRFPPPNTQPKGSNFGLEISLVTGRWTSFTLPCELKIKKKKKKEAWEPTLIPPNL